MDSRELRIVEEDAISDLRDGSLEGDDTIDRGLVDRIGDEDAILDLNLSARDGRTVDGLEVVLLREVCEVSDLVCGDDEVLLFGRASKASSLVVGTVAPSSRLVSAEPLKAASPIFVSLGALTVFSVL